MWCAPERGNGPLDLVGFAQIDRTQLHAERSRRALDDCELGDSGRSRWEYRMIAARVTRGAISLSSSNHFPLVLYSDSIKPVALPPGRATLTTNPPPTGSKTFVNTIGKLRVACCTCAKGRGAVD